MINDFFNHYILFRTFQWTSSECLTNITITVKVAMVIYIHCENGWLNLRLEAYLETCKHLRRSFLWEQFMAEAVNWFHKNFFDVLVICKDYVIETTVYHKSTNNDRYLHWQSFSPTTWKRGTLQTLVSRAFKVWSNDQHLQNEIKHLKKVFRDINGYPNWIIEQTIKKEKSQNEMTR